MNLNRKITLLIAILALFYSITLIQSTYAKYVTNASADAELSIARWNVLVNDTDVTLNSDFTQALTPVFYENANIKQGVLAPTSSGYFDIILDGTQTDVSFSYNVSLTNSEETNITDVSITSYEVNGTPHSFTGSSNIAGNILLTDADRTATIRVYISWVEGEGETMDNAADTSATVDGVAKFKANVNVTQLR